MIRDTDEINLTCPNGCHRIIRTKETIRKAKSRFKGRKTTSS